MSEPRLLDPLPPTQKVEEAERQRQKDVGALRKILAAHGVPERMLYRCRHKRCDAYRVMGEACVECGAAAADD